MYNYRGYFIAFSKQGICALWRIAPAKVIATVIVDAPLYPSGKFVWFHVEKGNTDKMVDFLHNVMPLCYGCGIVEH